jgi:ribosome recycling factor
MNDLLKKLEIKMQSSLSALDKKFSTIRTNRASPNLLDNISIEIYGQIMALKTVATISMLDSRTLAINVWDTNNITIIDKAIRTSELSLSPIVDGNNIKLPIPPLSEELRLKLVKQSGQFAEEAKVSIRNIRRDGIDTIKKSKEIKFSEDEIRTFSEKIQKLTDEIISEIDQRLSKKTEDLTNF